MDRLVIMDEGRIIEEGSHNELLKRGGLYADLWARQSGGFLAREAAEVTTERFHVCEAESRHWPPI